MGGQARAQLGHGQRPGGAGRSQVGIGLQAVTRAQVAVDDRDEQHREDAQERHHGPTPARAPAGDQDADAEPEDIGTGHVAAGQQRQHPDPGPAAVVPQVPGQQRDEQHGQAFSVEVEGDRPPGPRVDQEQDEPGTREPARVASRAVPFRHLTQPEESHQFRADHSDVLQPEQLQAARKDPVQRGQGPHDEFGVVLPEREVADCVVRVEVAVRDQEPGLLVLREVRGEGEVPVKQRAPPGEAGQLQSQGQETDPAHAAQHGTRCAVAALAPDGRRGGERPHRGRAAHEQIPAVRANR